MVTSMMVMMSQYAYKLFKNIRIRIQICSLKYNYKHPLELNTNIKGFHRMSLEHSNISVKNGHNNFTSPLNYRHDQVYSSLGVTAADGNFTVSCGLTHFDPTLRAQG